MRGVQLGNEIGGRVKRLASLQDCQLASVIVLVKRFSPELYASVKQSGRPWAWDIVDAYPQPACTAWDRETAIGWVRAQIKKYRPTGVIWPNQRMRDDCDTGLPGVVIPHHYRPGAAINPIREKVAVVGYEGSPNYIGEWLAPILSECKARGWEFRINQGELADWDIVIAARGSEFNGYAQSHWKSNVKLANAHGTGTPFIGPTECGYLETQAGLEQWADSPGDLRDCFDRLTEHHHRQQIHRAFIAKRYSLEQAGEDLAVFLDQF